MKLVFGLFSLLLLKAQYVGIGTPAPWAHLHVLYSSDLVSRGIYSHNISTTAMAGSKLALLRGRGTIAAPAPVQQGDQLGAISFGGHYGLGLTDVQEDAAAIVAQASENWSTANRGAALYFSTQTNGTTSPTNRMIITHDGRVGIGTPVPVNPLARLHVEGNIYGGFPAGTWTGRVVSACPPGTYPDIVLNAGNSYTNTIPPPGADPFVINLDGPSRVYVSAFVTMAGSNCSGPTSIEWVGIEIRARQGTTVISPPQWIYEGGRGEFFTLPIGTILDLPTGGSWQIEVPLHSNSQETRVYSFSVNAFFVSKL